MATLGRSVSARSSEALYSDGEPIVDLEITEATKPVHLWRAFMSRQVFIGRESLDCRFVPRR
jgi:hypothetical protein